MKRRLTWHRGSYWSSWHDGSRQRGINLHTSDRGEAIRKHIAVSENSGPDEPIVTYVYFIQAGKNGPIKIGIAADVISRLVNLAVAAPQKLQILVAIEGDRHREREFHRRFASSRLRGEWFSPTPDILQFIAEQVKEAARLRQVFDITVPSIEQLETMWAQRPLPHGVALASNK